MFIPKLAESESYVKGRSSKTAQALLEAAGDRGAEVRTTSHGYVVPTEFVQDGMESYTAADRPAVPTEPGTSTNVDEVNNVGQAATAVAEAKTEEAEAAAADAETDAAADADGTEDSDADADADADENGEEKVEQFDPTAATIAEVKDYLDGADATERERVLAAEAASEKPRKGVLDLAEAPEGAK